MGERQRPGAPAWLTRRRVLTAAATSCVLGAVSALHLSQAATASGGHAQTRTPEQRHQVDPAAVSSVRTARPWVAITFDDGPDPDYTPEVLDILRRYAVPATFFVVGSNATAYPDLLARIIAEGHATANHTQNHRWLHTLPEPDVRAELTLGGRHVAGSAAGLYRPPAGWTSPTVARVGGLLALRPVFWSDCVEAHFDIGARGAGRRVGYFAGPGSIILTHDGGSIAGPNPQHVDRSRSVAALPYLLEKLARRSLTPVTVPRLLAAAH